MSDALLLAAATTKRGKWTARRKIAEATLCPIMAYKPRDFEGHGPKQALSLFDMPDKDPCHFCTKWWIQNIMLRLHWWSICFYCLLISRINRTHILYGWLLQGSLVTGCRLQPVPKHFLSKNINPGKRRMRWSGSELRISCLTCTFLTISPTHHLSWKKRYFPFEVAYRWAFGTGW